MKTIRNKMLIGQRYVSWRLCLTLNSIKLYFHLKIRKRSDFNKKTRSLIREYIIEVGKYLDKIEKAID